VFCGGFEYSIDDKGRLIFPSRFRSSLGERFIITKGVGGCLFVLTEDHWRKNYYDRFTNNPSLDEHSLRVGRFFCAGFAEASADSQGRVAIPQHLRDHAGLALQSEAMVVGVSNRVEVWSKDRWAKYNDSVSEQDLAASILVTGIGTPWSNTTVDDKARDENRA